MFFSSFLVTFLGFLSYSLALDTASMRPRSVYQLVTDRFALPSSSSSTSCNPSDRKICGGTWAAIEDHLDYIQQMGWDTVWISPVVQNIGGTTGEGEAYHGYWSLDVSQLNPNFGTASDLTSLISKIHERGMYFMLDVVINHVAATSSSNFSPSSSYGAFSTSNDYHPFCWITDYSNQTQVEDCWLGDDSVALPDLNTESDTVINYWNGWIKDMISNYSVDAVRIDTVKHVPQGFWKTFTSSAGIANIGEVLNGDPMYVSGYQSNGNINTFNYPTYYPLVRAFNSTSGNLTELVNMTTWVNDIFPDPTLLGVFVDNHDNPRMASYTSDTALIANAHAFPFVVDGIPYGYYGAEQGFSGGSDPDNREPLWTSGYNTNTTLYTMFKNLNDVRRAAFNASNSFYETRMNVTQMGSNEILIVKGPLISLLSNRGQGSSGTVTIPSGSSGWGANVQVLDAVACEIMNTDGSGNLDVKVNEGMPRVMIVETSKGNVCSGGTSNSSTSTKSAAGRRADAGRWGQVGWTVVGTIMLVMGLCG
ncbi:hypothetical protein TREMEDRAFT_33638 [Tremella mesenterica DSM 1558]|uniref:uncharacterized protein n=1 Tax=Tremella mesenterica (strain ATCC 24925 / CBS 8224 / DSM 1558 / NBRC 9311 / NRRL Y-6157 / RJB 2259-6 / UBC 559-6) TaxID=578456 RepID=UPI0003F49072|nr:uncharacterized protein TREMEDRAFT_33638 [Tremella mesenterica DSM 1558]EIW67260.1 hypothetical protein TREMEDRAFT_33638 [Tremella mesenterica DSM 1558]